MPSNVSWLIEDHIIILKYTGVITTDDAIRSTTTSIEWLNNTDNTVHLINDLSEVDAVARNFQNVGEILKVSRGIMQMDNLGLMVSFGTDNQMIKFLSNVVVQVSRIDFRMFDTYDACRVYLQHNLPELSLPETLDSTTDYQYSCQSIKTGQPCDYPA